MAAQLALIRSIVIDIDGVLWRGAKTLPGVVAFLDFLRAHFIRFLLVTNNATRTPESLAQRFAAIGVSIPPTQILTSARATALYLLRELPAGSHILVVGEEGLIDALNQVGFDAIGADEADGGGPAAAVVVGMDRDVNYRKLSGAFSAIRSGARFVATNADTTFPIEGGMLPGAGAIVAAVQAATSSAPTVIGKPNRPMFEAALELLQTPPSNTAMLGDRLDTDIQGAEGAGLLTILVLTGVTSMEEANASTLKADLTFTDLNELRGRWEAELAVV
jgi:HAD superfamily hydrolase (TIGR01457 family)